ncbi:tISRso5 ISRSO5-transposase protein [mine drainage metagenome]|uniref:TISRso5 ISRSO5-transposase protein n=2 Tax=mine drainage metagenome TaxID=410659 RepID=T1C9H5_9ZZZZ
MRVAPPIVLTPEERSELESWARGRSTPHRLVLRAQIVLRASRGEENLDIAEGLHTRPNTVSLWRRRFAMLRLPGIQQDAPRSGRKPRLDPEVVRGILTKTRLTKPRGQTHWSTRTLAREVGVHPSTVGRIWRLHGLQPHRTQSFKLSKDPQFEEKIIDVVGIYMNPPERSVVFSIDEKPQTQALERTQTILPMAKDWPEGRPHDYRRHGTVDLYAALNILDGKVVTEFHERHRHQEFLAFLNTLDRQVPPELQVHVVLDNLSAHKTEHVQRWLRRHPRFRFHFTPTSSSWANMVEGWLGHLQKLALGRGSFRSVPELKQAILDYVAASNGRAEPWCWTKDAQEILRKVRKIRARLAEGTAATADRIISHPLASGH